MSLTNEKSAAQAARPLTVTAHVEGEWLRVEYRVVNRDGVPWVLYDGAGDPKDEWPDLAGNIYVSFRAPSTVQLKRVYAPPPPGMAANRIRIPAVTRLQPGEARDVRFRLRVPLEEFSEYFPHPSGAPFERKTARQVELSVGYFRPSAQTKLVPLAKPGAFKLAGVAAPQQLLVAAAPAAVEVEVRTDRAFQRV